MPRVDTIGDLLQCDASYVPEVVSGSIQSVGEVRSGKMTSPPFKDYSVQKVTIQDQTGRIDVHIWDREPLDPSYIGQALHVMSSIGSKGQRIGLKLEDRSYQGQDGNQYNDRRVKLYPTGGLSIGTYTMDRQGNPMPGQAPGSGAPARPAAPRQAAPAQRGNMPPAQQKPAVRQPAAGAGPSKGFGAVRIHSAKLAVMMTQAYRAALQVSNVVGEQDNYALSDAAIQAVASSIFISMERAGMATLCPVAMPEPAVCPPPQLPPEQQAAPQMANADADPSVDGPVDGDGDEIPF